SSPPVTRKAMPRIQSMTWVPRLARARFARARFEVLPYNASDNKKDDAESVFPITVAQMPLHNSNTRFRPSLSMQTTGKDWHGHPARPRRMRQKVGKASEAKPH